MVVLPIEYINTQDIYNAISHSLDNDLYVRLNYSELYNKVKQILRREVSHRDYCSCLKSMVNEKRLHRHEEKMGRKIATVYYSLTSTAKKESQFGILGIDSEKEKLRRLYQLLFFFQAIKPPNLISTRKLNRGLSNISISKKDLSVESHFHMQATDYVETNYKPVNNYKFRIVEYSNQGRKITRHYYKQLSFSLKDIIKYMKRQQKTPFDDIKLTPFINHIHFPKVTEEEIKKAMEKLKQKNVIKPIQNTFDRYDRQISFIISDDSLLDLINKIWRIHDLQFERLRKKITYVEQLSEKEKEWLKFEYGDNAASIFIYNASRFRKRFIMKNKKVNGDIARIQRRIECLDDRINQRILNINNKYGNIIEKFDFPSNILEGVLFKENISKLTSLFQDSDPQIYTSLSE